jgi:DNA-directed RNA polymerase specialized sigma24 family protein
MSIEEINCSSVSQLKFYNEHKDLAYQTVKKYLKNDFDIGDVVQSGFMKVFTKTDHIKYKKFKRLSLCYV